MMEQDPKTKATMQALIDLIKEMSSEEEMANRDLTEGLGPMQEVRVASPTTEGLEEGLSKADEILRKSQEDEMDLGEMAMEDAVDEDFPMLSMEEDDDEDFGEKLRKKTNGNVMSRVLKSSEFIRSVRRRAMVPENTEVYGDEDILDIANEELDLNILPMLLALNEEHLVNVKDYPVIGGQNSFPIPSRAIGTKLRDVALVSQSGRRTEELSRISLEELSDYDGFSSGFQHFVFYIKNNEVIFPSSNSIAYPTVRMFYYLRPSSMVPDDEAAVISSIDRETGTLTLANYPTGFSSVPLFDFSSFQNPNKLYKFDVAPIESDRVTSTIRFASSDIPERLQVGDILSRAGETIVPQLPVELHPILAQATAVHILEGLNDSEGLGNATRRLQKMIEGVSGMLNDRVEGAPKKIRQRHSTLLQSTFSSSLRRTRRR